MSTDRYTRDELRDLLAGQLPAVPAPDLDRVAGVLVLLLRPAASAALPPAAPPPAARATGPRRVYKEKPAAERLRLKK
ncbi:hypothetical protein [Hymenobacter cheonanensis]|uniref:hypothetical protein n=1 Tax=Hymenobacter sp. CA2-7 TaxID=3063993 RepID=UPI0027123F74|nr:hypothetical protein [Hymenobacter sp. CA2-7]MDO7886818.1 hypothetical protein [Hymenobacter sp. CA2-7]